MTRVGARARPRLMQILDLASDFRFHDTVQDQRVIGDFCYICYNILNFPYFHEAQRNCFNKQRVNTVSVLTQILIYNHLSQID